MQLTDGVCQKPLVFLAGLLIVKKYQGNPWKYATYVKFHTGSEI